MNWVLESYNKRHYFAKLFLIERLGAIYREEVGLSNIETVNHSTDLCITAKITVNGSGTLFS